MNKRPLFDASALRELPFITFALGAFCGFIGLYLPFFYVPSYALSVSPDTVTPGFSLYLISIMNAASVPGRILPNFFADKIGPISMIGICSTATAVLAYAWLGISTKASIIAFSVLYGFTTGGFVSLPPTCIVTMSPHLGIVGTRMGMVFFVSGLGVLVGNPVAGAILNAQGGDTWWGLKLFCALFATACCIGLFTSKGFKSGWNFRVPA